MSLGYPSFFISLDATSKRVNDDDDDDDDDEDE